MSRTSYFLLTNTTTNANVTGAPVRADGWYGWTNGLHSVAIYPNNLQGRVFIEASLATTPTDEDWFAISPDGLNPYMQFPRNPMVPTGTTGDTGVAGFSFIGNYLWLRARLDRTYLLANFPNPPLDQIIALGSLDRVLLNS